jgi:hypothetical protein
VIQNQNLKINYKRNLNIRKQNQRDKVIAVLTAKEEMIRAR